MLHMSHLYQLCRSVPIGYEKSCSCGIDAYEQGRPTERYAQWFGMTQMKQHEAGITADEKET
eukprot:5752277-Ditylum_brightwellii.AAC.1